MTEMFQRNYLQILEKCGDKMKIDHIKDMMATVTEEVESMLLDASKTRPLDSDEVEFLRSVRIIDRLKLNRNKTGGRMWSRHSNKVRFSPYPEISYTTQGPSPYGIADTPKIEEITIDESKKEKPVNIANTDIESDVNTEYMTGKFIELKIH